MTNIGRHIVLLLLSNDCVIVPDFGGFMVHHIDAMYDESLGLFYPPRKALGFNPQLKLNDSLLAYSYVEAYDMSYPEALSQLAADVEELVTSIKATGSYELDDIGVIRLNDDGAYEFEPFESGIATPSLYGLDSFAIEPLLQSYEQPKTEDVKPAEDVVKPALVEYTSSENQQDNTDDDKYIRIPRKWLRYAAVACAAILLVMMIPLPTNTILNTIKAGQMDSSLLYRILPKTITESSSRDFNAHSEKPKVKPQPKAKPVAVNPNVDTVKPAPKKKEVQQDTAIETQQETVKPEKCFSIVLASKVTQANAEQFVKDIAAKGYKEGRAVKMSHGYRVLYGIYASEAEAEANKRSLSENSAFADCWVMEIDEGRSK